MDTAEEQANALRGLADEFESLQEIDSNAPGFVIRIRGLQLRAAEIVMRSLTFKWLENRPFTDRLWWLAKHHAEFAEKIEPADVRRVVFLRNLWLDICGLHVADGERTENGVRILSVKGEPLFATPFESREIALQALQPDAGEFAIEAARQGRQRAAFICRTFATILNKRQPVAAETPPGQPGQPKIIPATDPEVAEFFRLKQLPGGDERDPIDICREIHASTNGAKPDSIKRKVNRFLKKHG